MFVGDISLGEYYTSFGHGPRSFLDRSNVFEQVTSIFEKADLVVGNLEASLSDIGLELNDPESVVLRGKPEVAKLLYESGFRVLQVANNHTVQHGAECFNATLDSLSSVGIDYIGVNNQKLVRHKIKNETVGFLAASDVPDNTYIEQQEYQKLNDKFFENVIESVDLVDHLFVLLHWGLESSTVPMDYQKKLIDKFYEYGVSGVIGSHPHLFYEIWKHENMVAAPSLGNFVFDLCWDNRLLSSGILEIDIIGGELEARVWPVKIKENGCLPVPVDQPVPILDSIKLYDNGSNMNGEQIRKLKYFFRNLLTGNTNLKLKFIFNKFYRKFTR